MLIPLSASDPTASRQLEQTASGFEELRSLFRTLPPKFGPRLEDRFMQGGEVENSYVYRLIIAVTDQDEWDGIGAPNEPQRCYVGTKGSHGVWRLILESPTALGDVGGQPEIFGMTSSASRATMPLGIGGRRFRIKWVAPASTSACTVSIVRWRSSGKTWL